MAQHDMVVDNANGATVRSDLNNALAALVSNSSGTAAPGTMYAYQLWVDTTNNKLKIRNAANSAWIEVANLSSSLAALVPAAGSAAAPSHSFTGDEDTGMYQGGANTIAFSTAGAVKMSIASNGLITYTIPGASYGQMMASWGVGQADANFILRVISGANSTASGSIQGQIDLGYSGVGSVAGIDFQRGTGTGAGFMSLRTGATEALRISTTQQLRALPTYSLTNGNSANVYIDASGDIWRATSVRASKTNIVALTDTGALIDALRPVSYESVLESCKGQLFWGMVAEDCAAVAPPLATFDNDGKPDNTNDRAAIALLVAEVQQLRIRVSALESAASTSG